MSEVWISESMMDKFERLGLSDNAWTMWTKGLCYCSKHRSELFVPTSSLRLLTSDDEPEKTANELVSASLWTLVQSRSGYVFNREKKTRRGKLSFVFQFEMGDTAYMVHRPYIFQRDNYTCRYCGSVDDLTLDHVVPRKRGGGDGKYNLVTACRRCNSRKAQRTPEEAGMILLPEPRM